MAEVALSQYDSDVTLEFELYASDGTFVVESGTTAVFRGSKPDKNGISVAAELESIIDPETGKNIYLATVDVIPQMTAVAGRSLYELSLQKGGEELNTANFILDIERAPLDADTLPSESVIRELVDVIDKADEIMAAAEAVTTAIDDTLTQQGKAADAKKVGDEISDIKADLSEMNTATSSDVGKVLKVKSVTNGKVTEWNFGSAGGQGLSADIKEAILDCFSNVAWSNEDGQTYYDALELALYPRNVVAISANYTQSGTVYSTDSLDMLKSDLVVVAEYGDGTTSTIPSSAYQLSGTLSSGTSIITVTYSEATTTFSVTVSAINLLVGSYKGGLSFAKSGTNLVYYYDNSSANRMSYYSETGDYQFNSGGNPTTVQTVYPIKVPSSATLIKVNTFDSSIGSAINIVKYINNNWAVVKSASAYVYGESNMDITSENDGDLYAVVIFRNSANSSAIQTADRTNWKIMWE